MLSLSRIIILGLLTLSSAAQANSRAINICWESELKPPYLELGPGGKVQGALVVRLEKILERAKLPYTHVLLPWTRCLQEAESGRVDLVPNASYKAKRAQYAYYSAPVYASELVLYYNTSRFTSTPVIQDLETLSQYKVGGMQGFNYSFYQDQVTISPRVKRRAQLIDMLKRKRVDFAVLQSNVVKELVKGKAFSLRGIDYIPDPVKPRKEYHILVSKQSPQAKQLLNTINSGLDASENSFMQH